MRLDELAGRLGARVLTPEVDLARPVEGVYAGDRMSDLLNHAGATTLVVTNLATPQLMRAATLMDASGICLLNGVVPEPALLAAASAGGTAVVVSPFGMFETCGRLYQCLSGGRRATPQ
ncbi:MAG TPA: hypothetical protein VNE39_01800 [Planctomycetota bacterium]|nr:hypothetical protein [Planctomycetota bacterium]